VGYGRRFIARESTLVATVPIGYGDGWRRALTNDADVIIRGRRHPLIGTVSMDNITIDVGPDSDVTVGDEVTLLGGGILAEEVARRLGTINYEVTCGLTARVVREHL
jgi:alanine racemase